jgi:putative spermidine/putrescine transport system permease protein
MGGASDDEPRDDGPKRDATMTPRRRHRERSGWELWLLPMLATLAFVFAIPIIILISVSFHSMSGPAEVSGEITIANYREFATDSFLLRVLTDTLWLGCMVVGCCLALAYPISYFLARRQSRWRGMLLFLVISPLLISAVVRNIGWFPILNKSGLINWILINLGIISAPLNLIGNYTGVVIGLVHALLPFMILTLMTVIQRIDVDLEEAAANLGAGPLQSFFRVLLPLSLPGVIGGSLLVFALAISAYTTPVIMGGGRVLVMATYIAQQFRTVLDYGMGATAAAVLMIAASMLTIGAIRLRTRDTVSA